MIHPSYTELMNVINKDVEPGIAACNPEQVFPCNCYIKESKTVNRRCTALCKW